ncbi:Peptidase S24/S26A/S26B/S26C [Trypanosoma melophagium]|uniref:Peptidase S24/S26A/S26B/S26C n=1 Tax=Trypanosoma melophagium TaxID=715481 RepID=UPI00351A523A|nr:Peptidase S24/S26A/S26B/S26C [Trypanosoma melophagium]
MSWCYRLFRYDLPYALLGGIIGWNCDVSCYVQGRSMFPTLAPGDYVLFFPYAVLNLMQSFFSQPLVKEGDVVVVRISPELTVCKRVTRLTTDRTIAQQWNDAQFTEIAPEYIPPLTSNVTQQEQEQQHEQTEELLEEQEQEEREAAARNTLAAYARAHDWDECLDRVDHPAAWMWLEGDNPPESFDSRHTGAIPLECLRGLVLIKLWPVPARLPPRVAS